MEAKDSYFGLRRGLAPIVQLPLWTLYPCFYIMEPQTISCQPLGLVLLAPATSPIATSTTIVLVTKDRTRYEGNHHQHLVERAIV